MSLKVLELGRFSLVNTAESFKLEVVAAADFKAPPRGILDLDDDEFLEAVTSRKVWVSRGRGCRIDIEVLLAGKALDSDIYSLLLEILGRQIRDAKPWNQIFLSTSLELFPDPSIQLPHLSISLNSSTKPPEHEGGLAAWIGNVDVVPPSGVLCAQFERLRIYFNFMPIQEEIRNSGPSVLRPESSDIMPLESSGHMAYVQQSDLRHLEQIVEDLRMLPSQLASNFGLPDPGGGKIPLNDPSAPRSKAFAINDGPGIGSETVNGGRKKGDTKRRIPERAVTVLKAWFDSHLHSLYPTREEKRRLMADTGLRKNQLEKQFYCRRQKMKTKMGSASKVHIESQNETSLDSGRYGNVQEGQFEEEEMPFSQSSNVTSIHSLQSSILSTLTSTTSTNSSAIANCESTVNTTTYFDPSPSTISTQCCSLADMAFRGLMGAAYSKPKLKSQDLLLQSGPELLMSTLVPSMFSPGFKNSMAGHSRFLTTISQALSISLAHNVQTPSLRRKLLQLSNLEPSHVTYSCDDIRQSGTCERLSSAVQSRLWTMAQRKVFDASAGRKLWRQSGDKGGEVETDFEDMLERLDEKGSQLTIDEYDEMSDEEMLLAVDYDGDDLLLHDGNDRYNINLERREIEDGIEYMLLGDEGTWRWEGRHDEVLLGDGRDEVEVLDGESDILLLDEIEREEMLLDDTTSGMFENLEGDDGSIILLECDNEHMLI